MGFKEDSRPEDLIMQSLLVMPPISRPPFIADGRNNPDELTEQYKQIVICANNLRLKPDDDDVRAKVFSKIKALMIGRKQQYKTKVPKSSISTQLQGKKAVPRNSLMGKRTNMCARTVISPDTSLEFGQIRVPEEWAPMLNMQEMVREDNIEMLQAEVKRGKIAEVHTYHESTGGFQRNIATVNTVLRIGDKAWRHLRNGDVVALNRQPTLHKFSMMAFEVVLSKERTLGLHFAYTTPFGADFDGDTDADARHILSPTGGCFQGWRVTLRGKHCKLSQVCNHLVISSIYII
jgi:DNA-directed RNA polymerase beta' subunit